MDGRAAALDLGDARVGVAISDELGLYAHPAVTLPARPVPALLSALALFVKDHRIAILVVGLPLDMRGGEGDAARKARRVSSDIGRATGAEIVLIDERLTTVEAHRSLSASEVTGKKRKQLIDQASAVVMLQSFLDRRRHAERPAHPARDSESRIFSEDSSNFCAPEGAPVPAAQGRNRRERERRRR